MKPEEIVEQLKQKVSDEMAQKKFISEENAKELAKKEIENFIQTNKESLFVDVVSKKEYEELKEASKKQGDELQRMKIKGADGKYMTYKQLFESISNESHKVTIAGADGSPKEIEQKSFNDWISQKRYNEHFHISLKSIQFVPVQNIHNTEYDLSISQLPRKRNDLMSAITKRKASKRFIKWMDKESLNGNAVQDNCTVGLPLRCGDLKPLIDGWKYVERTSEALKFAGRITICEENLTDHEFLASEIEFELNRDLENDSAGFVRSYLISNAPAFQLTDLNAVTTPNLVDAIKAACSQPHKFGFETTHVVINSTDYTNMQLLKDSCGRPLIEGLDCGEEATICCAKVIIDDCIASGSFLLGDFDKFNYRTVWERELRIGYGTEDFERNRITMIMEERAHVYIKTNEKLAFVYDTFENVIAAFGSTTPGTPLALTIDNVSSNGYDYVTGVSYTGDKDNTEIMAVFSDATGNVTHVKRVAEDVQEISAFAYTSMVKILSGATYAGTFAVYAINPNANNPALNVGDNISTIDPAWVIQDYKPINTP